MQDFLDIKIRQNKNFRFQILLTTPMKKKYWLSRSPAGRKI